MKEEQSSVKFLNNYTTLTFYNKNNGDKHRKTATFIFLLYKTTNLGLKIQVTESDKEDQSTIRSVNIVSLSKIKKIKNSHFKKTR